jgi:hypothetical protein
VVATTSVASPSTFPIHFGSSSFDGVKNWAEPPMPPVAAITETWSPGQTVRPKTGRGLSKTGCQAVGAPVAASRETRPP